MSIEFRYYSIFTKSPGDLYIKKYPDLEFPPSPGIFDSDALIMCSDKIALFAQITL